MKILRDQIGEQVQTIHRLDCPTSGVLLFATDRTATRILRWAFEHREVTKTYWAIVSGSPSEDEWASNTPLRKSEDSPAREAITDFRVLQRISSEFTLLEATPHTGRYHQIRRHLLQANHPIVGDYRYTDPDHCDEIGKKLGTGTRMLLQAKSIKFSHPITQESTSISAPTCLEIETVLA